jgi:hypothetical protein
MNEEDIEIEWIPDTTGRFRRRPWHTQVQLDEICERILFEFLSELYGQITVPVPTGALIKLIERDARELNLYADLTEVEEGLLGVTFFDPPGKPEVRIVRSLYQDARSVHRCRFTLAHEYIHVHVHNPLYQKAAIVKHPEQRCTGDETLALRPRVDWMEWQASYAAGALLMPISRLKLVAEACLGKTNVAPVPAESPRATDLKQRVSEAFFVSAEAARVRLIQLGYLSNESAK